MNESEFWNLIESARRSASTVDKASRYLVDHLKEMSVSEIVDFGRHYRNANRMAYDERLWVAAITISEHYTSDDVCDWLIAQGKTIFDRALANPDSLADLELVGKGDGIGHEGFTMASVASEAYEEKTGQKNFSHALGLLPPPELKNANTWDGNPETLKQIVPRLHAKYATKL
jgi:hypothetical protein